MVSLGGCLHMSKSGGECNEFLVGLAMTLIKICDIWLIVDRLTKTTYSILI